MNELVVLQTAKEAMLHILQAHSLTKYALAKRLGISAIMIDHYITGRSNISSATASKVRNEFNVSITDVRQPGRQPK